MTEPTKEQIEAWWEEWARTTPFYTNMVLFISERAAAWAREQALEEAAKVCDDQWRDSDDAAIACGDCATTIRALKERP